MTRKKKKKTGAQEESQMEEKKLTALYVSHIEQRKKNRERT